MGALGERLRWMDQARGVAILLVVMHHSMTWVADFGLTVPPALIAFDDIVSPFRMPLLMFLSGILVPRALSKPTRAYATGKLRAIGWPYLLWSVIFLVVTGTFTLSLVPNILLFPPTYLWYLWFLLAYYALAWLLARAGIPPLWPALAAMLASGFAPEDYRMSRFLFLLAFFLLGWAWSTRGPVRWSAPIRRLAIGAGLAAAVAVSAMSVAGVQVRYEPAYAWGVVGLIVAVATVLPGKARGRAPMPVEYVGRNSIVFYVTHYTLIWMLDSLLIAAAGWRAAWVVWTIGVVAAMAAGTLLCMLRTRAPLVGWLFEWPASMRARAAR